MSKDTIYKQTANTTDFTFNHQVADVFDDMVNRSVPLYSSVIDSITRLLAGRQQKKTPDTVYDLGCSTGTTLLEISRRLSGRQITLIGIDNSPSMIERAKRKVASFSKTEQIVFREGDITATPLPDADIIICNYMLQFVRPVIRQSLINRLYDELSSGGMLIISEKTLAAGTIGRTFIDIHHEFKREQGYSELEISQKREALENVLIPFTVTENMEILRQAGFAEIEIFSKWFNFASFVAIKK
jgi:tRNA (cmo5U34)-methyltransferase